MPRKTKKYNNFEEMDDIPKKNKKHKKNYNDFGIYDTNKKDNNNFEFDKAVISPSIINKKFPQISSIVEEYKKSDKNLEEDPNLEKLIIQEFNSLSKVKENKKNDNNLKENLSLEKPLIPLIQELNSISSKVEENIKIDKNLEEKLSLQKPLRTTFHFDSNFIPPIDIKNKEYLINLQIKNIYEKNNDNDKNNVEEINDKNNVDEINDKINDKNNDENNKNVNDENNNKNNDENNKNVNDKNNNKNNDKNINKNNNKINYKNNDKSKIYFYFDKNIISLPYDLNENITFQTFQILEDFKNKSYEKILLNSNSLIQPKIPFISTEISYIKPVFYQYKKKYIFTVSKESFISKIKLKDCNFNEIEKINDILKRKKYKNIFENNKSMLNEKPIIELNENKNECLISYQTIINKKKILFENNFSFDRNTIKKLDETHNIDINYFDSNKITNLYKKKNLKLLYLNNNDTVKKVKLIIEENEKNDTIFSNNQKRLIKKGFTKRIEKPETDNEKINLNSNIFHRSLIENINNKKFISFSIENSINEKIKINKDMNIFSRIIYTYKQDINTCEKIKIPKGNSIEEVNDYYSKKNLIKINSSNNLYSKKDDLDIFNDIDLDYNYKLYKKFKEKKRKKMNKFLKSGKASTFLVNNDNLKMNIAHSQAYYNSNYNNIVNKEDLFLKKDSKKFKSLQFNSTSNFSNKNKIEFTKKSNKNYSDLGSNDNNNEKEKEDSGIILKKIMKTNSEIKRKNKKVYINKLKVEQDNKFEQELKKEKRFKYLFPIFFSVIPLFYALYQKFIIEE